MKEQDPYESEEYQRFVDEMAKHCKCRPPWDSPCAGVLAGGMCDMMGHNEGPSFHNSDDDEEGGVA